MGFGRADKTAQYWRLITLLVVLVVALVAVALLVPSHSTGLLMAALPVTVVILFLVRYHRSELEAWQDELQSQLPVDRQTGAATQSWFKTTLEQECRRAIREFTPITVIRLVPVQRGETLHQAEYVQLLQERMTRPGDMVAIDSGVGLMLLLPATNEAVIRFGERVFHLFNDHYTPIHLFGFTFQPVADLNGAKVTDILSQLYDSLSGSAEPCIKLEAEGLDMPSVTYSV